MNPVKSLERCPVIPTKVGTRLGAIRETMAGEFVMKDARVSGLRVKHGGVSSSLDGRDSKSARDDSAFQSRLQSGVLFSAGASYTPHTRGTGGPFDPFGGGFCLGGAAPLVNEFRWLQVLPVSLGALPPAAQGSPRPCICVASVSASV